MDTWQKQMHVFHDHAYACRVVLYIPSQFSFDMDIFKIQILIFTNDSRKGEIRFVKVKFKIQISKIPRGRPANVQSWCYCYHPGASFTEIRRGTKIVNDITSYICTMHAYAGV
jgi:hypothetical protein